MANLVETARFVLSTSNARPHRTATSLLATMEPYQESTSSVPCLTMWIDLTDKAGCVEAWAYHNAAASAIRQPDLSFSEAE
jgi:hypothetical protein